LEYVTKISVKASCYKLITDSNEQNRLYIIQRNYKNKSGVTVVVLNATVNDISVIPWWSALLVEETGVAGENH
jgi:hypothetical protein